MFENKYFSSELYGKDNKTLYVLRAKTNILYQINNYIWIGPKNLEKIPHVYVKE